MSHIIETGKTFENFLCAHWKKSCLLKKEGMLHKQDMLTCLLNFLFFFK